MGRSDKIATPIPSGTSLQCTLTPPWFVQDSEYNVQNGSFEFLINGERAFGAVHRAIAAAKKSVCIICWGFQPSMYFIRDGKSPSIGKLLEQKAAEGVKIRILCYSVGPYYVSGTGVAVSEPNTPNRSGPYRPSIKDVPQTSSTEQNDYDSEWFSRYDRDRGLVQAGVKSVQELFGNDQVENLIFRSRGFTLSERNRLRTQEYEDRNISSGMRNTLAAAPSHHQKMVLIDYDSPTGHIGFPMGHNMLDEYWDTSAHSHVKKTANTGRNGALPRQDLSSRVTGPICSDLFRNFSQAWQLDTGEALRVPPALPVRDNLGTRVQGQILRTQPQYGVEDIKKVYLQAANNASQSIYIENQYFRWPPLADKIKAAAAKQCQWGRDPALHKSLYLFVVTNSSDSGMGSGTVKTHEMLSSLGRSDTMPGVELQQRIDNQQLAMSQLDRRITQQGATLGKLDSSLPNPSVFKSGQYPDSYLRNTKTRAQLERYNDMVAQRAQLEKQQAELEKQADNLKNGQPSIIQPEPRPGLKVHVCTLVPPDTPAGRAWDEVYVHSKLMIVNDTFMTLGSTNINSRSMEVDSELNIAHCNPHISKKARLDLWQIHTKGVGAQEDVAVAYISWGRLITENKNNEARKRPPEASLRGFMRIDPTYSDSD